MTKILLPNSDFTAPPEPKKQANVLIFGDAGTGKTTFVVRHAPEPVAFLSYDRRGDYAANEAHKSGRRILFARVELPLNVSRLDDKQARKAGQDALDKTIRNLETAVRESQKGNVRTITLDTVSEYADLVTLAFRGRADKVKDFGDSKGLINNQMWRLFTMAREGEAHLIVLSRAKAIWENNSPTGKFTFRCPEVVNDAADWSGHLRLAKVSAAQRGSERAKKHELEITKAGLKLSELGEVYTADDWGDYGPFVWACTMNYPNSDPSAWE